ncbi:F0F1 ATP synthase subunit alpha [Aerococcaceae bacterium DSM 111176]|nr:F0F1 ATP synthase subunit alpha [Aerococcaceae bacterium DSM 111176]
MMEDNKQKLINKIQTHEFKDEPEDIGVVTYVGDGIARISGLNSAMYGEMVLFRNNSVGMIQNLNTDEVGVIVFGSYHDINDGELVRRLNRVMEVPVGDGLLGRVVNPLGEPIDGLGAIETSKTRPIEADAPNIMDRQSVSEPMQTGIKAIDSLVPIGRGQRELIIGDRKTGKTTLAVDAIINQADKDVICIYVAIGQKESTVKNIANVLEKHNAMDYTIIMSASASNTSSLLYLAPYAAMAMAEEFMYDGKHVLIIFDDLSKQATAYREMSLLLKRPPGREAYPGDVFYLHSRLLERAAKLNDDLGGGSITAIPIVETQGGDISAYIPTNVISITDGQIFLESDLFNNGVRPAINAGLSVSRVGGSAQRKAMKQVSGTLRIDLSSYRELEAFSQFGSELDDITKKNLDKGERTVEILKQSAHVTIPVAKQVVIFYALAHGYLEQVPVEEVRGYEKALFEFFDTHHADYLEELTQTGLINDEELLNSALTAFTEDYLSVYHVAEID